MKAKDLLTGPVPSGVIALSGIRLDPHDSKVAYVDPEADSFKNADGGLHPIRIRRTSNNPPSFQVNSATRGIHPPDTWEMADAEIVKNWIQAEVYEFENNDGMTYFADEDEIQDINIPRHSETPESSTDQSLTNLE